MTTGTKKSKSAVIRARCENELKSLAAQAAIIMGIDEADIVRLAVKQFAGGIVLQQQQLSLSQFQFHGPR